MKKTPRSMTITVINHGRYGGHCASISIQRNVPVNGEQYYDDAQTVCNGYDITTHLRMIRCLWLQAAFLARGGTLK